MLVNKVTSNKEECILIHAATDCDVEYKRFLTLLTNETITMLRIHALETAIDKAMNMVLKLQKEYPDRYVVEVFTSSLDLLDNLQVIADNIEAEGQKHSCAAMHIVVKKMDSAVVNS